MASLLLLDCLQFSAVPAVISTPTVTSIPAVADLLAVVGVPSVPGVHFAAGIHNLAGVTAVAPVHSVYEIPAVAGLPVFAGVPAIVGVPSVAWLSTIFCHACCYWRFHCFCGVYSVPCVHNLARVTAGADVPSVREIHAVAGILCTLASITGATSVAGVLVFAATPAVVEPLRLKATLDLSQHCLHRSKMAKTQGTGELKEN